MKNDNKFTKKTHMGRYTVMIFLFIFSVVTALYFQMVNHNNDMVAAYESEELLICEQLADTIKLMYDSGSGDADIVKYLATLEASGSRFFVLSKETTIIFAKNEITTEKLAKLKNKALFYQELEEGDNLISSAELTVNGRSYEISIVSDTYSVRSRLALQKNNYSIMIVTLIISLVMISMLEVTLNTLRKTRKELSSVNTELSYRNTEMEQLSLELTLQEGDKADMDDLEMNNGITQEGEYEFYNIYMLKTLIMKSDREMLKPYQVVLLNVNANDYSKDKLAAFAAIDKIKANLKKNEVICEIKDGLFAVVFYKTTSEILADRLSFLNDLCEEIKKTQNIKIAPGFLGNDSDLTKEQLLQEIDNCVK